MRSLTFEVTLNLSDDAGPVTPSDLASVIQRDGLAHDVRVSEPYELDERLMMTPGALRDHMDGDEDAMDVLERFSDEDVGALMGDEYVYNAWHDTCKEVVEVLGARLATQSEGKQ